MSARLVPVSPGIAPQISLQRPVLLIGRHPECDIRIDSPKISRRHCCIALAYNRIVARDLGSRNGLRVNGVVVEEALLNAGDEIAIGPIIYRVEVAARPAVPAPAPPAAKPAAAAARPSSLPNLPVDLNDSEGELVPLLD